MSDPATNLAALQELKKSTAWRIVSEALSGQMSEACVPAVLTGKIDDIAINTISRSAGYHSLRWVRDRMLDQLIEREKKALNE